MAPTWRVAHNQKPLIIVIIFQLAGIVMVLKIHFLMRIKKRMKKAD
jgi:hypothetical protein